MNNNNKKEDTFEMIEILENAAIIYDDGDREIFEAIFLTDNEVIFGWILKIEKTDDCKSVSSIDCHEKFIESGGIPKDNIKHIKGGIKKKVFKK